MRENYLKQLAEIDNETVVYVDETGIDRYFTREFGRAPRGSKIADTKRGRRFQRTNVIGGICCGHYFGIECYNHSTNSDFFVHWFKNHLLPEVPVGHTIVMDNATFHPKIKLYNIAKDYGINLLFLPPYSPDFNPIEKSWANLKRWLRDNFTFSPTLELAVLSYFCC